MEPGLGFDEALRRVGGHHLFQYKAVLATGLISLHASLFIVSLPFLLETPPLLCDHSGTLVPCEESEACGSKFIIDPKMPRTITKDWNLVCENKFYTWFIPLIFIGSLSAGILIWGKVAERFGRSTALIWGTILSCLCEFVLFCSASPWFFSTTLLVLAISISTSVVFPFVYLVEVVDPPYRPLFFLYNSLVLLGGLFVVPNVSYSIREWRALVIASLVVPVVCFPLFLKALEETPRFLAFNQSRYIQARDVFKKIAETNSKTMFEEQLEGEVLNEYDQASINRSDRSSIMDHTVDLSGGVVAEDPREREEDLERGQKCSYFDLVRFSSLRCRTFTNVFTWICLGLAFEEITSIELSFETYYWYSIVIGAGSALALVLFSSLSFFIGTKKSGMINAALCLVLVVVCSLEVSEELKLYLKVVCKVSVFPLVTSKLLMTVEHFPTPVRALGTSLCLFLGMKVLIVCGLIRSYVSQEVLIQSCVGLVGAISLSFLYPASRTKLLDDVVEEIATNTGNFGNASSPKNNQRQNRGSSYQNFSEEI